MAVSRELRAGALFLAAGATLSAIYFAFPAGGTAQSTIYAALGGVSALAIVWAIRLHRPERRLPWLLFALGNASFVVGDVIDIFRPDASSPSARDYFYLAGYPLLAAGLVLLVVSAGGRHRLAGIADAGIVTFAFAIAQWTWVMGPAVHSGGSDLGARIVYGLYPAMDVVLLAGFAGFFISPAWRTWAFRLLVASVALLVLGDELYGLYPNTYSAGDPVDVTWMLSYVLFATAALHPSMRELSRPRQAPALRVSAWRIALLTAALLAAPTVFFVRRLRHERLDVYEVAPLAAAITLLVVARLTGILRGLERIRLRERAARTLAEEAQEQLAEQNEQLVEADRLKDEFVALISHDLRTPLTSIIGYVELALDEDVEPPLDEERRSYLEVVSRSSERLLRLVDDLLFVARLQAGRLVLEASELDLSVLAAQAVEEARPRAESQGLALSFLGDSPVVVEADKGRIFQLLDNLISNALKFTPREGRIDVRVLPTGGGGAIEVSDTGIGLTPREQELVFDRFYRSTRAAHRQVPGTGLGLFIARAIAEAHGGRIAASSREGGGTTFRIELPSHPAPRPSGKSPSERELVA